VHQLAGLAAVDAARELAERPPVGDGVVADGSARLPRSGQGSRLGHDVLPVVDTRPVEGRGELREAAGVREHVAHGHGAFAVPCELRPPARERRIVRQQPTLVQAVDTERQQRLGGGEQQHAVAGA